MARLRMASGDAVSGCFLKLGQQPYELLGLQDARQ